MRALVTGGGGFLGAAIVRALVARGDEARSFSRRRYPELEELGVSCFTGDVADAAALDAACAGVDAVFHVAAKVGLWGDYADFARANIEGTRRVIGACQDQGVPRLVFTSSPSVVFDGRDVEGADETAPYPARFDSHYSRTKAVAEEMVLSANGIGGVATVALRPHLIWGPGDRHILPRLVAQARAGRLRRIGDFNKRVDTTYIDDAAQAHVLAAARLALEPSIGGRAYFISQGDPRPIWEIINGILAAAGLAPVERSVSPRLARAAAGACELAYRALGLGAEPRLTRFLVSQLSTAHWFDISAARRDLGFSPRVTIEEGLHRLALWLKNEASKSSPSYCQQ